MNLCYEPEQIRRAAKYVWKKNPSAKNFSESEAALAEKIKKEMLDYARSVEKKIAKDKDWRIFSTGGYTILIMMGDKDWLDADILVDPCTGKKSDCISVSL